MDAKYLGRWWHREGDRFRCELCPRACLLSPGQRAFCFMRSATEDGIVLDTYGRSTGFAIDPIEKKPLFHFLPGSGVLSFGTAGCNLGCRYCQNWDMTKSRDVDLSCVRADPATIANAAVEMGCASVAFTYNDPVPFAEYAIDTAIACREKGIRTVGKTAGYICADARAELFEVLDAVNIDLKSFSEKTYAKLCLAHLAPVLETIEHAVRKTRCWVELTTLLIPGFNDSDAELDALTGWVAEHLGPDVPLHFTAFWPDYKMRDVPPTALGTIRHARRIGQRAGLRYVYAGNVRDEEASSTYCPGCGAVLIERVGMTVGRVALGGRSCLSCGEMIPGVFDDGASRWHGSPLPRPVTLPEPPAPPAAAPGGRRSGGRGTSDARHDPFGWIRGR